MKRYTVNGDKYVARSRRDAAEMWGKYNAPNFQHGVSQTVKVTNNNKSVQMIVSCIVTKVFIARPEKVKIDA